MPQRPSPTTWKKKPRLYAVTGWVNLAEQRRVNLSERHRQEQEINRIQTKCAVDYVGGLAGYRKGHRKVGSRNVLITQEASLARPRRGKFPLLKEFIDNLLSEPNERDQPDVLFGWLQLALRSLYSERVDQGPALILVGPPHTGKSLVQRLITDMFGGRVANPYQYMTGQTPFNSELFEAEHLAIEDQVSPERHRDQSFFGQKFKEFCVNEMRNCHRKGREQITLKTFCRLTMSVNNEDHCIATLPRIMGDTEDKVIVLQAGARNIPVRKKGVSFAQFYAGVRKELPHLIYWLLIEFQLPERLRGARFGINPFKHAVIREKMEAMNPDASLLELIDRELFGNPAKAQQFATGWTGNSKNLEYELTVNKSSTSSEARTLWMGNVNAGRHLSKLMKKFPARFGTSTIVNGLTVYRILPPNRNGSNGSRVEDQ